MVPIALALPVAPGVSIDSDVVGPLSKDDRQQGSAFPRHRYLAVERVVAMGAQWGGPFAL